MKFRTWHVIIILLLLSSCSTYQKVSLKNHTHTGNSDPEWEGVHYVLKRRNLHYTTTEKRFIINNYNGDDPTSYESRRMNVEDNVLIPKGASGVCVNQRENQIYIDFGKGVVIPFLISGEKNSPKKEVVLNGIRYSLVEHGRQGQLFCIGKSN